MISYLGLPDIRQNFNSDAQAPGFFFPPKGEQPMISEPYRIASFALGLYHQGEINLVADLRDYCLKKGSMIFLAPQVIREWSFSKNTTINSALFFSGDFLAQQLGNAQFSMPLISLQKEAMVHLDLNGSIYTRFSERFAHLFDLGQKESPHQKRLIAHGIMQLLLEMDDLYQTRNSVELDLSRAQQLTNQFKMLISKHVTDQRHIAFYAEKLAVTSKHLSETLKQETGKSAGELIAERIILEAKVLLQDFEKSAAQIAFMLSFSNASQFGKYFKTNTGMAPGTYRKKLR